MHAWHLTMPDRNRHIGISVLKHVQVQSWDRVEAFKIYHGLAARVGGGGGGGGLGWYSKLREKR